MFRKKCEFVKPIPPLERKKINKPTKTKQNRLGDKKSNTIEEYFACTQ